MLLLAAVVAVLAATLGAWLDGAGGCGRSGVCERLVHRLPPLLVGALMGALARLADEPPRLPAPYTWLGTALGRPPTSCRLRPPIPNEAGLAGRVEPRLLDAQPRSCA